MILRCRATQTQGPGDRENGTKRGSGYLHIEQGLFRGLARRQMAGYDGLMDEPKIDESKMDESKNPWTVLTKSTAYENEWIRVDHHDVRNPLGGIGIYGVVHFKGHAIGVVPIDETGNVVLVGQYRFPLSRYSWEIPQGGGHPPVPIIESAQRELCEECGLIAKNWLEILVMDLSNSVTDERGTAFLAWELSEGPSSPEDTEQLQVVRVPFWEAVERAKRGEIRDSVTISALLRVALMVLQNELPPAVAPLLRR